MTLFTGYLDQAAQKKRLHAQALVEVLEGRCFLMSEVSLYSALREAGLAPNVPTIEVLTIELFGNQILNCAQHTQHN
jgi:hypothetical protein